MNRLGMLSFCALLLLPTAYVGGEPGMAPATDPSAVDTATLPGVIDVATTAVLQRRDDVVVLDVREQWEYDEGHIPGVVHIPMNTIPTILAEIPTDKTVIVTCRSGNRSGQVTDFLRRNGFTKVHNMGGGIVAWQAAGLPVERNLTPTAHRNNLITH